jgi:hypothetical protein
MTRLAVVGSGLLSIASTAIGETLTWWRFEEKLSGMVESHPQTPGSMPDTVLDSSGNGNHLQSWLLARSPQYGPLTPPPTGAFGGIAADGRINRSSLLFDGVDDDLYVAGKPINTAKLDQWTVEASVILTKGGRWQVIVGKDGNPVGGMPPLALKVRSDDRLEIGMVDGSGTARWVIGQMKIIPGKWYHFAAAATADTLSLWIKPEFAPRYFFQGSAAISGAFFNNFPDFNRPWTVGRGFWNGRNADLAAARIDEVRIPRELRFGRLRRR